MNLLESYKFSINDLNTFSEKDIYILAKKYKYPF